MIHLKDLIAVLDVDTHITITATINYKEIYDGFPRDFNEKSYELFHVKAVWFSKIHNSLMIEL